MRPSAHTGCHMKLQRASQGPTGKPKGAQRRPKGTLRTTKIKENDPRGAKRGPRKNTKAKLQYYLVNNTIQEAKLQYYLVNNTIQKSVFYGFSWKLHSYAVNNTIQEGPKAANWVQTATPGACKSYSPYSPASPPFPTNPPLAPRVLILTFKPSKECFPESAAPRRRGSRAC